VVCWRFRIPLSGAHKSAICPFQQTREILARFRKVAPTVPVQLNAGISHPHNAVPTKPLWPIPPLDDKLAVSAADATALQPGSCRVRSLRPENRVIYIVDRFCLAKTRSCVWAGSPLAAECFGLYGLRRVPHMRDAPYLNSAPQRLSR